MKNTPLPTKKKLSKRTKFTIFSVANLFWYTVVVLILSFFDKSIPSELTISWFSAWTVELALLFGIKVKSKSLPDYYDLTPDQYDELKQNNPIDDEFYEDKIIIQDESNVPDYDEDISPKKKEEL